MNCEGISPLSFSQSGASRLFNMFKVAILAGVLVGAWGHEFPRGPRIRFPYEGPPPFGSEIFLGPPRIYGAESQSHAVFHEPNAKPNFNFNDPFNVFPQKPSAGHPFGEVGPHGFAEGIITKPYINQHRSRPRPRENPYHETQPPPFAQTTKVRGVLNVPPPPPPTSMAAGTENEPHQQRHRFSGNRDPNSRRRPTVPRPPPLEGHPPPPPPPPIHSEKYPVINERYPPYGDDGSADAPERHRPIDRPNKEAERYQERIPPYSEKPFAFKEKAKVPFNGVKKPLFSPTNEKPSKTPRPTQNPTFGPQQDSQEEYYQSKLAEEYYSGVRNPGQRPGTPTQPRPKNKKPGHFPSEDSDVYNFNEAFNFAKNPFNIPNLSNIPNPTPFSQSSFPQSGEFHEFFDSSMPEWVNDFKQGSGEPQHPVQQKQNQKQTTQESLRTHYKQPQGQKYFEPNFSYEQGQSKYVDKRNPSQNQSPKNTYDSSADYDERQTHQKAGDGRPQQESSQYYDSQEFDFGSSSEFSMPEFHMGSFNFGHSKSSMDEWIPINAPDGAISAKSYEIPAPDLSQEFYHSSERQGLIPQHHQERRQHQQKRQQQHHTELRPTRNPSSRADETQENGNVVYGARENKRHNEGVVSASVMVKQ